MNFQLTAEQQLLRDSVRRFATETLPELAEQIEKSGKPPSRELICQYAELGYLGVNLPEELGGPIVSMYSSVGVDRHRRP